MNWYILDYNRGGIYKIEISEEKLEEIRQNLINKYPSMKSVPDEIYNMDDEEVLDYYGFHSDECQWMITDEDLSIETINEPLK